MIRVQTVLTVLDTVWPYLVTVMLGCLLSVTTALVFAMSTGQLSRLLWRSFVTVLRWCGTLSCACFMLFAYLLGFALIEHAWPGLRGEQHDIACGRIVLACIILLIGVVLMVAMDLFWRVMPSIALAATDRIIKGEVRVETQLLVRCENLAERLQRWGQKNERN